MLRYLAVMAVLLGAVPAAQAQEVSVSVGFDTFDRPLAAHGEWVVVGSYGRVWRPHHVIADWRPYIDGHWVWTDDGWLWVSDEPWAWATYHYGRWSWEPGWGWIWVPGYEWAPAWVEWRYSEGCVGWAPLFPTGIVLAHRPVYYDYWTFVPSRSFVGVPVRTVMWTHERIREHWHRTVAAPGWHEGGRHHDRVNYGTPAGGTVHQAEPAFGPPRTFVEREIGRPVQAVRPVQVSTPAEVGRHPGAPVVFRPSAAASRVAPAAEQQGWTSYPAERPETRPAVNSQPMPAPGVRPEPMRPTEPRPAVTRPEPARPAPVRPTVSRPEPMRPEPVRPMVTRPAPVRPEPIRPTVTRPAPVRPEPMRPVVRPDPVRPERQVNRPSEMARPVQQQPARPQPAMRPPSNGAPAPQPQHPNNKPANNDRRRR